MRAAIVASIALVAFVAVAMTNAQSSVRPSYPNSDSFDNQGQNVEPFQNGDQNNTTPSSQDQGRDCPFRRMIERIRQEIRRQVRDLFDNQGHPFPARTTPEPYGNSNSNSNSQFSSDSYRPTRFNI